MTKQEFQQEMAALGLNFDEKQMRQFEGYLKLLQEWNQKMNLTALDEDEQIWEKHFFDSIRPFVDLDFETLIDVGSGAGFPGIPVQIAFPERRVTLLEPMKKRCVFLQEVKDQLDLPLEIVNERAEDYGKKNREKYDAASARAVAALPMLLELSIPMVKEKGHFLALKGSKANEELEEAAGALKKLDTKLEKIDAYELSQDESRINLLFEKEKKTSAKYPRAFAQIKKNPLK